MEGVENYCIDSDILIDYLRGFHKAKDFFLAVYGERRVCISMISVVEIYSGASTKDTARKKKIDEFLTNFEIIPLTIEIAKRACFLRRELKMPFADMIVAASALEYRATLATKNIKHYQDVPALKILQPYSQ